MNYETTTGTCSVDDNTFQSYGIRYGAFLVEHISSNRLLVEQLVSLCNQEKLEPIHLPGVVDDFLADPQAYLSLSSNQSSFTAEGWLLYAPTYEHNH
ncbi:MAG: DUF6514 family protein [Oscillospiraceae bacterium]